MCDRVDRESKDAGASVGDATREHPVGAPIESEGHAGARDPDFLGALTESDAVHAAFEDTLESDRRHSLAAGDAPPIPNIARRTLSWGLRELCGLSSGAGLDLKGEKKCAGDHG